MLRWSRLSRWRLPPPLLVPVRGVRCRAHPHIDKKLGTTYTEIVDGQEIERTVFQTPEEMTAMEARARSEIEALLASSRPEGEEGAEIEEMDEEQVEEADEPQVKIVRIVDGRAVEVLHEQDNADDAEDDYSPSPTANYRVRKEKRLVHGHEVETEIYNFPAPGQSVEEMEVEEAQAGERTRAGETARTPLSEAAEASTPIQSTGDYAVATPAPPRLNTFEPQSPYRFSTDSPAKRGYGLDISIDIDADADADYTVEIDIESEPHIGPHGTALQHQRWMERHLSIQERGIRTGDVETPLRAAHAYLDSQEGDVDERSEAYWRFLREFLKHPLGGRPALDLVRRQAAEGVPFTVKGAITAFKAARNFRPVLRDLLPILPAEMTTELVYIFAVALVNEQRVPPDAVRAMIGQSLAAVRQDRGLPPLSSPTDDSSLAVSADTLPRPNPAPVNVSALPTSREMDEITSRTEVPSIEWSPELFFPIILAYMPHADFRGALGTLNDLRAAARMKRERTIAAGEEWPGEHAQAITKCYTAVMSLWLRSQLAEDDGAAHLGRVGRRLGSAVPHRLAVDLGNLLAPAGGMKTGAMDAADPIRSLSLALDAADSAGQRDGKYHFRNPFLNAWLNAERAAGNAGTASGVWSLLSGQSIAASVAGVRSPRTPNPEGYQALFRLLRQYPPASYRPVVATVLEGEVTTEVLNMMLSAASFVPKRARTDWAALTPPWEPAARQPLRAPAHVPSPDLPLIFVLAEEHTHLMNHQSVNIICAALIRAARITTTARGVEHPVLLSSPAAALTMPEWKWLEQSLWSTEMSEAHRTNRGAHKPPPIPVDAADLWDTERWRGQISEGEGRARWLLIDHIARPLRRQLVEGMIEMARGVSGTNAEIFTAELRLLQDDMRPVGEIGGRADKIADELELELELVVPPPAFVPGRKDRVWSGQGRRRKGMTRSAATKSALQGFFDMMDEDETA